MTAARRDDAAIDAEIARLQRKIALGTEIRAMRFQINELESRLSKAEAEFEAIVLAERKQ
jgi:hypothetical protein